MEEMRNSASAFGHIDLRSVERVIDGRGSGQNSRRRHKDTPRAW